MVIEPNVPMSQGQSEVSPITISTDSSADIDLVGQHLGQRRDDALALLDLAGEAGDAAVGADPEKGVEIVGKIAASTAAALGLKHGAVAEAEENDDPAAEGLEKIAARQVGVELDIGEIDVRILVVIH